MSSSRNTANTTTTAPAKPFCKVCRDAGKPESEYTSHFVKDQPGSNGKVICPTLLNQACRICEKTGHTSSYCPQYRRPSREERYIEREPRDDRRREEPRREEPRREERYIEREPRDDRRREEPRREERYIEREPRDDRRREERRDRGSSYDRLREDTERREREIRQRDDEYYREQDRRSKPWLQAALKKPEQEQQRRGPYAHPHGPRVRLNIEAPALSVYKHADAPPLPAIDVRNVELNHASAWGDEDMAESFVCDPEQMTHAFLQNVMMSNLTTSAEHDFMAACDDQSQMPFFCGQ